MNLKNVAIYTSILLIVVVFGVMLENVVLDLQNDSRLSFSEESITYMNNLVGAVQINNLKNVTDKTATELQEDTILLSNEDSGESSITDNLAPLNFFKSVNQKIINPVKFIFNVPGFLMTLLLLPIEYFSILNVIINLVFYIGLITMIVRELK